MNKKLKIGTSLFALGLLGILTLLTVSFSFDSLPKQIIQRFSAQEIKFLILINPTIFLLIATIVGTIFYDKVGLSVPTISSILKLDEPKISFLEQIKYGVSLGLISGILLTVIGIIFKSSIPQEFLQIADKFKPTILARFGYGGITEELLMRYGFMTLVIWVIFKITRKLNDPTYWIGIVLAALLFAVGHFPVVFSSVKNPTISLLTYVLTGNTIGGVFFGWLYWKKGLEAAFIGHIFAHVAMLMGEQVI